MSRRTLRTLARTRPTLSGLSLPSGRYRIDAVPVMHLHAITVEVKIDSPGLSQRADTCQMNRRVELLTREGCMICSGAATRLKQLADELGFELAVTDVDAVAAAGDSALRAEFGDRLPVVLLDGAEHSYWEVDEPRLRADLARG
jgi:Glutaredoxin-like domain (DUF836)